MNALKRFVILSVVTIIVSVVVRADSLTIHRFEADVIPCYVLQTNRYLRGDNRDGEKIGTAMMARMKYAFQRSGDSLDVAAYQGLGIGYMLNHHLLGNPFEAYVYQGAPILRLAPSLTLNYELLFGGSFGWQNIGSEHPENHVLGSWANFYIGADLYFCWQLSPRWDLNFGGSYVHYSNANLRMPNEGLNMVGLRTSLAYYLNRSNETKQATILSARTLPKTERWTTDVVIYGGWKEKSRLRDEYYGAAGFNISPTFHLNEAIAIGPSFDGVYDHCINVPDLYDEMEDMPSAGHQMALGLQARAELTMPVMRASCGAGYYFLGGFTAFYETLALKIDFTRSFFLNVGYCLYNYKYSNSLMLGIGCRFGNHHKQ